MPQRERLNDAPRDPSVPAALLTRFARQVDGVLPADQLEVKVSAEKAAHPARLAAFSIELTAPGLDERHEAGILRAAKTCLIHHTLLGAPTIDVRVNAGNLALV